MEKKRGVSYLPEDRNYDLYQLACKVTARRFFPNFLNLDATFNQSEDWKADDPERYIHEVATMGCRTRVFENRFGPKTSIGRGNLSFSTINIVRLAIECMQVENKEERIALFSPSWIICWNLRLVSCMSVWSSRKPLTQSNSRC